MSQPHSPQPIPLNTVLGERYLVTDSVVQTEHGDAILEGKDQVINRKVSIAVATPAHNDRLIANARTLVTKSRSPIQILDLGNTNGRAYLITAHTRAGMLLDTLFVDSSALVASSETQEALGQEIFGDDRTTGVSSYVPAPEPREHPQTISATRSVESAVTPPVATAASVTAPSSFSSAAESATDYPDDPYDDYYEDDYYEDEDESPKGRPWIIAIAAIILLLIGVAAVFSTLNGMLNGDSEEASAPASSSSAERPAPASSESNDSSPTDSASPTSADKPDAHITGVSRIVPNNPNFMADQDRVLSQITDGNDSTTWMSYGFATPNFGGAATSVALSFQLEEKTTVSELIIDQASGSGGAFTVLTNSSPSLEGATEVGSGSFAGTSVNVSLDEEAQGDGVEYVIVNFTEAPQQAQPIAGYNYGIRIAEVKLNN